MSTSPAPRSADLDRRLAEANAKIEQNPADPLGFIARAALHRQAGLLPEAVSDLTSALEVAPGNAQALLERGIVYRLMSQHQLAL
ncbi:MAG: hypothetical protein HYZ35_01475, partial [Chloroflexi bacterium]|nr:hypothetical protein [Chloroflexota bacterium]